MELLDRLMIWIADMRMRREMLRLLFARDEDAEEEEDVE